jgi:hypothetical protein
MMSAGHARQASAGVDHRVGVEYAESDAEDEDESASQSSQAAAYARARSNFFLSGRGYGRLRWEAVDRTCRAPYMLDISKYQERSIKVSKQPP